MTMQITVEEKTNLERMLGFTIVAHVTKKSDRPFLRYLDGNGALSRHGREPTECELRMWFMLLGEDYEPWSLGPGGTATQSALQRLGVGMPLEPIWVPPTDDGAGDPPQRGGA